MMAPAVVVGDLCHNCTALIYRERERYDEKKEETKRQKKDKGGD